MPQNAPDIAGDQAGAAGVLDRPVTGRAPVFVTLDGLRGIAALAVVTFHYRHLLGDLSFASAYLAVDLFFIISGIVIATAYEDRLRSRLTVAGFMRTRLIRLMPLYLVGHAIGTAVAVLGLLLGQSNWTSATLIPVVVVGALMIPNVFPAPRDNLYPLNIPCWSLFWEVAINLVYAWLLPSLRGRLPWVVLVASQIALAWAAYVAGGLDFGHDWKHPEIGLLRVTAGFFAGVLLARWHKAGRRLPLSMPPLLLLLCAGLTLAQPASWGWLKDVVSVVFVFPLLCAAALGATPRHAAPYLWLGMISYPVYIVHATLPIDRAALFLFDAQVSDFVPWVGFSAMIFAIAVAWLLARFFDIPVRRFVTRMLGRTSAADAPAPTLSAPST